MRFTWLPTSLLLLFTALSTAAPVAPATTKPLNPAAQPTMAKLDKAKAVYQQRADQTKADLLADLENRESVARNKGDKSAVDQVKSERSAYLEKGRLPTIVSATAYERRMKQAVADLETAYSLAIKDLVRLKEDDSANALSKELAALKAGEDVLAGWVDLVQTADLTKVNATARWARDGAALVIREGPNWGPLDLRYAPPDEYEIQASVARLGGGNDCFEIGTIYGGHRFFMVFDAGGNTGIAHLDGKWPNNETVRVPVFDQDKPSDLSIVVKKTGISVTINGKPVLSFNGKPGRVSEIGGSGVEPGVLFLSAGPGTNFRVHSLRVKPLSGKGKLLDG